MALTKTPSELTAADITITTAAQPNITSLGTLTTLTIDDITINGSTISDGGDLTLDVAGNIILDADGGEFQFKDGGTHFARIFQSGGNFYLNVPTQDTDLIIQGNDGGSNVSALTFDMSDAGAAQFNSRVGIGVAAHATAGLNITSTDQNIRLNNGSELGIIDVDSDGHLILWAHGDGETIDFKTGSSTGTIAMSVVGTNVGIGATPETWNSNFKALQIGPWGSLTTTTSGNGESFRVNANYYNDGSAEKYLGTGYALMLREAVTGGSFIFSSSQASGSADGSIASWYHSEIHNHSWAAAFETTTSDGSDNWGVGLDAGGGAGSSSRGAALFCYGNEHGTYPGNVNVQAGSAGKFIVYTGSGALERMRIDSSGHALIGRTSASFGATTGIVFRPDNDSYIIVNEAPCLTLRRNTTNGDIMQFYRDGTQVGYISVTASATSYQSGSDYRLKDNVTYDWEALPRLAQLKPARFNFKVDPDSTVDGFLAHEAQAVVPNAVGGTYNETKDISNVVLDAEGNVLEEGVTEDDWKAGKEAEEGEEPKYAADTTWKAEHTKNIYQGMDHSKLVPLMVKAIQEQQTLIETLEAKVKALEEA